MVSAVWCNEHKCRYGPHFVAAGNSTPITAAIVQAIPSNGLLVSGVLPRIYLIQTDTHNGQSVGIFLLYFPYFRECVDTGSAIVCPEVQQYVFPTEVGKAVLLPVYIEQVTIYTRFPQFGLGIRIDPFSYGFSIGLSVNLVRMFQIQLLDRLFQHIPPIGSEINDGSQLVHPEVGHREFFHHFQLALVPKQPILCPQCVFLCQYRLGSVPFGFAHFRIPAILSIGFVIHPCLLVGFTFPGRGFTDEVPFYLLGSFCLNFPIS